MSLVNQQQQMITTAYLIINPTHACMLSMPQTYKNRVCMISQNRTAIQTAAGSYSRCVTRSEQSEQGIFCQGTAHCIADLRSFMRQSASHKFASHTAVNSQAFKEGFHATLAARFSNGLTQFVHPFLQRFGHVQDRAVRRASQQQWARAASVLSTVAGAFCFTIAVPDSLESLFTLPNINSITAASSSSNCQG